MKAAILVSGFVTRLIEGTSLQPKPMIEGGSILYTVAYYESLFLLWNRRNL
jgi:NDP-sugar pyrophosphorylase family protein